MVLVDGGCTSTRLLRQAQDRSFGGLGCWGLWFETPPFDRLRAGSPMDSGAGHRGMARSERRVVSVERRRGLR